jgi:hypothetical protein
MALDGMVLGRCASEQMEALENDYGDDEEVRIGAVMTIVEVVKRKREGEFESFVRVRHNVPDTYRAIGVLHAAENQILG